MPSRAKSIKQLAVKYSRRPGVQFDKDEVEKLLRFYRDQTDTIGKEKLDRTAMRDVVQNLFHITDDMIMDRVFRAFDHDNDTFISMDEWVRGLSTYLRGDIEDQLKFTFNVYDLNNDGYISREEMFQLLKHSIVRASIEEEADESIKDLVDIALKKMDRDSDGRVSLQDFKESVLEERLLLEAFGTCLPTEEHILSFMETMEENSKHTPAFSLDQQKQQVQKA